jgi:hypothetical protein
MLPVDSAYLLTYVTSRFSLPSYLCYQQIQPTFLPSSQLIVRKLSMFMFSSFIWKCVMFFSWSKLEQIFWFVLSLFGCWRFWYQENCDLYYKFNVPPQFMFPCQDLDFYQLLNFTTGVFMLLWLVTNVYYLL